MKKKLLLLFVVVISSSVSIFADYRLDLFSMDPLYEPYIADRNRSSLSFNVAYLFDGIPTYLMQEGRSRKTPTKIDFKKAYDSPMYSSIHIGETLSILRHTFTSDNRLTPISFDFSIQFLLKFVMDAGLTDLYGNDGVYFFGGTMRMSNILSMRVGLHHYSSHYGSALLYNLNGLIDTNYKYIRMNSFIVALCVEPIDGIRLYGEYSTLAPGITSTYKPFMFSPYWYTEYRETDHPKEYNARIINFGVELSYPLFEHLGKTTLAYDCHMYEEGKIHYKDDAGELQDFEYREDSMWEVEHGLVLAQQCSDLLSIEIGYYNGRHILNNFYYQRSSYVTVGMRITFNGELTLFNSAKR